MLEGGGVNKREEPIYNKKHKQTEKIALSRGGDFSTGGGGGVISLCPSQTNECLPRTTAECLSRIEIYNIRINFE